MGGPLIQPKLGAHVESDGVSFAVWAPFAQTVALNGDFNNWAATTIPMQQQDGVWTTKIPHAKVGQEYKYIVNSTDRNDPRALQLTATGDASVIVGADFDWGNDMYELPPTQNTVLYELHVGTFVRSDPTLPGTFYMAIEKLDYLAELGINVIEVMPCCAVWMDRWWGYTPTNLYAVEAAYGGRRALQEFVREAHKRNIGVVLDVVYNHLNMDAGSDLWRFDGWSEHDGGGIYFYNDWRAHSPWGAGRPDYGRPEVRDYIVENARMWLRDCHADGLRVDSTLYIRNADGKQDDHGQDLADGWKILQEINDEVRRVKPQALTIAEDLQGNVWLTKPTRGLGAGFGVQWDASLASALREVLDPLADEIRDVQKIRAILMALANNNPFERVIYSESHDTDAVATGGARLGESIEPGNPGGLYARRRSALAAAILMSTPGVPMLFQGQEFQQGGGFASWEPLDWSNAERYGGILQLYNHLIALRLNAYRNTAGLLGSHIDVFHVDDQQKLLAYHRWDKAGAGDDVVVVANLSNEIRRGYELPFPAEGRWWVRLNTDWNGYSDDFSNIGPESVEAKAAPNGFRASVDIGPYAVLILSLD